MVGMNATSARLLMGRLERKGYMGVTKHKLVKDPTDFHWRSVSHENATHWLGIGSTVEGRKVDAGRGAEPVLGVPGVLRRVGGAGARFFNRFIKTSGSS